MKPVVSILMGSTSDFEIMEKAASLLNEFEILLKLMPYRLIVRRMR
jgi:phosphoribosylcarboxyaminoimidazole (NCAIR) mutase